ncbi:hypothetical protein EPUS_07752 [Endocarpon pusillum Z07020]|uniref:NadR/Ttd14 AAA domain-containing protein n=1 Tax=Endocarpon pusillum (strain Z07020 / HMAS-L-300199) TaxID=1263415 RepID=U1HLC8_ENDPU|nr:uncharacterized protein EPUS_07752 [Endocarpon pusillum Z07020]ERF71080.1 hypothetical protein EPUS_07752 [Endocarpon pusillum Z07020]
MAQAIQPQQRPKNIYIVGAQSSGKTTLISGLEKYFHDHSNTTWGASTVGTPFVLEEVARKVPLDCGCTGKTVSDSKSRALRLQRLILETQFESEDAIKGLWSMPDQSGLAGESETEQLMETKQCREMKHALQNSLIIVCEPVVPWLKGDGLRLMPKDRSARTELVLRLSQPPRLQIRDPSQRPDQLRHTSAFCCNKMEGNG